MKKIVLTFAAAMVAMVMDAQVYLGGTVGFTTVSQDGNSTTAFNIKPEVGYNLDNSWALGIVFGYGEKGKDITKVKTFTVNPYARYTFVKFDRVSLFLDGGFSFINTKSNTATGAVKNNKWEVGVKPGVAVALNDKISFVSHMGFLGYSNSKDDTEGAKAENTFGVNVDATSLDFGFYFNF